MVSKKDQEKIKKLMAAAEAKFDNKDYEGVIKDLDEVIQLDPENSNAWSNRGAAKANLERFEDAINDYDEAIRLDPENSDAWNNRGAAKANLKQFEDAINDYDKAIDLNPESPIFLKNRGISKGTLGHHSEALKDFSLAQAIDSTDNDTKELIDIATKNIQNNSDSHVKASGSKKKNCSKYLFIVFWYAIILTYIILIICNQHIFINGNNQNRLFEMEHHIPWEIVFYILLLLLAPVGFFTYSHVIRDHREHGVELAKYPTGQSESSKDNFRSQESIFNLVRPDQIK